MRRIFEGEMTREGDGLWRVSTPISLRGIGVRCLVAAPYERAAHLGRGMAGQATRMRATVFALVHRTMSGAPRAGLWRSHEIHGAGEHREQPDESADPAPQDPHPNLHI